MRLNDNHSNAWDQRRESGDARLIRCGRDLIAVHSTAPLVIQRAGRRRPLIGDACVAWVGEHVGVIGSDLIGEIVA